MKRVSSLTTCSSTPSQRLVGVVAGALLLIGSTACGPSARASQENAVPSLVTPGAGASAQDVLKPYRDLVQCARQHGLPGLADPILDEAGQPAFTPETNRAIKMSWEANR